MAAYICARAQGLPFVAIDGVLVAVAEDAADDAVADGEAAADTAAADTAAASAAGGVPAELAFDGFVARAHAAARSIRRGATSCERLREGGAALLGWSMAALATWS